MSRRFRDPALPASSPKYVQTPSHPSSASTSIPQSARARFARPSTASQPSAPTPGSSTSVSRFRDRPRVRDEIETSLEDEADASSLRIASRVRFSSFNVSKYRDFVDDLANDDDGGDTSPAPKTSSNVRKDLSTKLEDNNDDDNNLADLEFLESLRGTTRARSPSINCFSSSSGFSSNEDSPLPTATTAISRKRRRLMNRTDHDYNIIDQQIEIEQEHDETINIDPIHADEDNNHQPTSSDLSLPSSPLSAPRTTVSSRFKALTHPTTTTTPSITTKRPSFRPPPSHPSHQNDISSPSHLPPSFSPSRRKGKVDYIHSGAADTVRSWILGLASVPSLPEQGQKHRSGGSSKVEKVKVSEVVVRGGRFALLRGHGVDKDPAGGLHEEEEREVGLCLIYSDGKPRGTEGLKDRVVGVRMGWNINLHSHMSSGSGSKVGGDGDWFGNGVRDTTVQDEGGQGKGKSHANRKAEEVWKVGVLWDVLNE